MLIDHLTLSILYKLAIYCPVYSYMYMYVYTASIAIWAYLFKCMYVAHGVWSAEAESTRGSKGSEVSHSIVIIPHLSCLYQEASE